MRARMIVYRSKSGLFLIGRCRLNGLLFYHIGTTLEELEAAIRTLIVEMEGVYIEEFEVYQEAA